MFNRIRKSLRQTSKGQATCAHLTDHPYCPLCGKKLSFKRIDASILDETQIEHWLTKVFRQTLLGLFIAPGQRIRTFISSDREVLSRPLPYLVVMAALATWTSNLIQERDQCGTIVACQWTVDYPLQMQVIQAMIFALVLRFMFFRHSGYNIWEFATLFVFLLAQTLVISSIFSVFQYASGFEPLWLNMLAINVYLVFAVVQFLGDKSFKGIFKVVLAVLLSFVLFLAGALALAFTAEWATPYVAPLLQAYKN